jgi:hypothetical protein
MTGRSGTEPWRPYSTSTAEQLSVAMLVYRLRGLDRERIVLELIPANAT